MATSNALFEAPASHEVAHETHYSNPELEWEAHETHYSNPEAEWEAHETHYSNPEAEWEAHETHYSNPEAEWEAHETHYSNPESEWEAHETHYSNPEAEWEAHETHYSNPEAEWEAHEAHYSSPEAEFELEDEGEFFFKRFRKIIGRVAKIAAPIAKRLAPFAAKALVGMIPGVGAIAAPLAGKLVSTLVQEGESEAAAMEATLFSAQAQGEMETEAGNEAMLTEVLAAQAAEAAHESEAEAAIGATLPITIRIMGGRRALRRVTPVLATANGALARTLRRHGGPAGGNLLRTIPAIQRRTVASLRAASRRGQPITPQLAVRTFAASARRALSNSPLVTRAIARNIALRQKVAPPHRHAARNGARAATCANCMGLARRRV
jgi:hypothetical protein